MNEHEQIKHDHPFSYRGIFHSYNFKEIRESVPFWLSLSFSTILLIVTGLSQRSYYDIMCFWTSQMIAIFPNLLGFNLGGYALIVGFGNSDLVQSMTKKKSQKNATIFQKLSGIFAFAILLQVAGFITAFAVNFFVQFKFESSSLITVNMVNGVTTAVLFFLGMWGLFIIPNLVSNVFNFGQMHHFLLTMKRIEAEREESIG